MGLKGSQKQHIDRQTYIIVTFLKLAQALERRHPSIIERSILAIKDASYSRGSKGGKGTGSAFDVPTQVTINVLHMF